MRGGIDAVRGLKFSASDVISEDAVKMYPCGSGKISVPCGYFFKETSMTGYIAAMLYSCDASLSLMDVRNRILQSARPLESLSGKVATGGMLDAGAAMP